MCIIFFVYDRVKKSLPENYREKAEASLLTAVVSAGLATLTCYPLDTIRRQMQMKGTPYKSVIDAFAGKIMVLVIACIITSMEPPCIIRAFF